MPGQLINPYCGLSSDRFMTPPRKGCYDRPTCGQCCGDDRSHWGAGGRSTIGEWARRSRRPVCRCLFRTAFSLPHLLRAGGATRARINIGPDLDRPGAAGIGTASVLPPSAQIHSDDLVSAQSSCLALCRASRKPASRVPWFADAHGSSPWAEGPRAKPIQDDLNESGVWV